MNVLLAAMKRLKEQGGTLELAAPRPAVKRILQVTGLDTVFRRARCHAGHGRDLPAAREAARHYDRVYAAIEYSAGDGVAVIIPAKE